MKINYFFATIIILLFTSSAYSAEPSRASWNHYYGPQNQNHNKVCGNNKIKFSAAFAFPSNWRNEWDIGQIAKRDKNFQTSHITEVTRWTTIPEDNSNNVFIISWHNMGNSDFGWTAIKNTKEHWYVASDQNAWTTQARYTRDENMIFRWQTNGASIMIHLRNPNNENGWTSEDIWYTLICNP